MFALLNECSTLWSSSGLNEALKSIADATDFKYDGTVNALLESMTYVHHIDAFALQNHVVNGQQPTCSMSLLTAGAVPGMQKLILVTKETVKLRYVRWILGLLHLVNLEFF